MPSSRFDLSLLHRNTLSGAKDPGDRLTDGNLCACLRFDSAKNPVARRLNLHDRFVGFDLEQRLALRNNLPFLLEPGDKLPGFLRHFEGGHDDADWHRFCRRMLRAFQVPVDPSRLLRDRKANLSP